tara:strand:+ start:794 stop:1009 length:216 start_codon:yes stop_codon:yes gene_type:complete
MKRDLLLQSRFLLKKKLMSGGRVTDKEKEIILKTQLHNICELVDGKLNHQHVIDSKGNASRRIVIEYKEND